jgi:hypothetical protein
MSFSRPSQNTGSTVLHVVPLEETRGDDISCCDEGSDLVITDPTGDDDDDDDDNEITSKKSIPSQKRTRQPGDEELQNEMRYGVRMKLHDTRIQSSPELKVFHSVATLHEARQVVKRISSLVLVKEAANIRRRVHALEQQISNSDGTATTINATDCKRPMSVREDEMTKAVATNFPPGATRERTTILQQAFRLKRMSTLLQEIDSVYCDMIGEIVQNPYHGDNIMSFDGTNNDKRMRKTR